MTEELYDIENYEAEVDSAESQNEQQLRLIYEAVDRLNHLQRYAKAEFYRPNAKQLEFHALGAHVKKRMFFANNRGGKTTAGAFETYCHMRGEYPDWWTGKRFKRPVRFAICGISAKQVRGSSQRVLLGDASDQGTGMIPKSVLAEGQIRQIHGVAGAVDWFAIPSIHGGNSVAFFCSAEQGWQRLQGEKLDGIWPDEEMPPSVCMIVFDELITRTWDTPDAIIYGTMTPQNGLTDYVQLWWQNGKESRNDEYYLIRMEIDEAEHLPFELRESIKKEVMARYPHMADARLRGIPVFGAGKIFTIPEEEIAIQSFDPRDYLHWQYLGAMDLGFSNSFTALGWFAYDPHSKHTILFDTHKIREATPDMVYPSIHRRDRELGFDQGIPFAWPIDAKHKERSTGNVIKEMYQELGVNMIEEFAGFEDSRGRSVEEGIAELQMAFRAGLLKVLKAPHMDEWWNQYRTYSRDEDGEIVITKKNTFDFIDMTRYGYLMVRRGFAQGARSRFDKTRHKKITLARGSFLN